MKTLPGHAVRSRALAILFVAGVFLPACSNTRNSELAETVNAIESDSAWFASYADDFDSLSEALYEFFRQRRFFPSSLDELVPDHLVSLPAVVDDQSFRYEQSSEAEATFEAKAPGGWAWFAVNVKLTDSGSPVLTVSRVDASALD